MTDSEDSATGTSRIRTLTEKGKIYQLELLKEQLSSAQRAWRKQMNNVSNVIVDSSNADVLKSERSFLETKMEILNAANERLNESLEENFDDKREVLAKFDSLEREHSLTLRKINDRILEIRQETGSGRSQTSKRSSRISQSRKSEGPSVASSLARKSAIAANVARLKTELEFADAETRKTTTLKEYEDELKRFKLTKELALAKAEMETLIKTETDGSKDLPQEFDRNYVLENYLQAQALSVSNTAGNSTVVTDVQTTEPWKEDPCIEVTPALKDEPENTPLQFNLINGATCTSGQKSMLTTTKSLNPFAPEFEARVFQRSEEPYYLAQTSDPPNKPTVEDSLTSLANILSKRRLQDSLPLPEPEVFSGDLLNYPVWLKSFETIIERFPKGCTT